jgi:hypothetical protein
MDFDDESTKCLNLENATREPISNDIEIMATPMHKKYAKPNTVKNTSFRQHCAKNFSKSKMKTIKLTMTVIALYIICSTPYFIGLIMNLMLKQDNYILSRIYQVDIFFIILKLSNSNSKLKKIGYLIVLSCQLFNFNSCVNPW